MVRWIFLGLLVLLTATAASADDRGAPDPCDGALFAGPVPTFRSGDFLPAEGVFALALQPVGDIVYVGRPLDGAMAGPATGYGGVVTFESLAAGRYAVVLSHPARIAALQHRPFQFVPAAVRIDDVTCPNPAELRVEGGAVTLQLSDAAEPLIRVAVIRLRDRTAPAPPR